MAKRVAKKLKSVRTAGLSVSAATGKPLTAKALQAELRRIARPEHAKTLAWFFKTGPGQYGEGDEFIGVKVPDVRRAAREFRTLPIDDIRKLLASKIHEDRLAGLVLLVEQFRRGDETQRRTLYDFYLASTDRINNWDLVDVSAAAIVGGWLETGDRRVLRKLAKSKSLWERRISVVATHHFIRQRDFGDTLELAECLLADKHDLIHKAVGWMLREVGKRDEKVLTGFLETHYRTMPRTMLRYAIERLPERDRRRFMAK